MCESRAAKSHIELGLERLVFFSDAVMAIAITLSFVVSFLGGKHESALHRRDRAD